MRTPAVLLLAASAVLAGCGDLFGPGPITELPRDLTPSEMELIDGSNAFAFGALREMRALRPDSPNTFLSPLSASMALGMTLNGADGETWTQMRDMLGFAGMEEQEVNEAYQSLIELLLELDPAVELGLGNAIWVDHGITLRPTFVERTRTYFDAVVDGLDFHDPSSADVMNRWVDSVTNGRIDELVEQIDPGTVLFLINAVYFNADWRTTFDEDQTQASPFLRADGSEVTVQMMFDDVGYRTLNAGNPHAVQGVELPYGGGAYTAIALMPPEDVPIDTFVAGIDEVTWTGWMQHFDEAAENEDLDRDGIRVGLPKFELEWGDTLDTALRALGMTDAFDRDRADFSRIPQEVVQLFVDDVRQKTYVRVDEQGTEAAAATSVGIMPTSAPPSVVFYRPFLFAIRERYSGTILFIGVIGDPSV